MSEQRVCKHCGRPSTLENPVHEDNGLHAGCECKHGQVGYKCPLCWRNAKWQDMGLLEDGDWP